MIEYPETGYLSMKLINKTKYAILGVLLAGPSTGYEIKSLMNRSTVYFWRESDSTLYPMLKVLAKEGKVSSEIVYSGKKKKEIFSITEAGRAEFSTWLESPTGLEIPRNEFLLKLFFLTEPVDMVRLFQERLQHMEKIYTDYQKIATRLESLAVSPSQTVRLKTLRYGITHLNLEINWLKENIAENING